MRHRYVAAVLWTLMFESSVVDSIAVSVFADIFLLSLTNIRRQDPNNYSSDSVAGPCLLGCGIAAPPPWDFIDQRWNNRIWGPGSLQRRRQQITCFQKHESILIISILILFRSIYVHSSELWKMFFLWMRPADCCLDSFFETEI